MTDLMVGTVATPQPWRRALHAHVRDHAAGVRLVVLHNPDEAVSAGVDVVVVDDTLDFFTRAHVSQLRQQGVRLVGVFDPSGRRGRGRRVLDRLGVDAALPISDGPEALIAELAVRSPTRRVRDEFDEVVAGLELDTPRASEAATDADESRGWIVVVAGGTGAPGRTEVAAGLARYLAQPGEPTVLVDLDEHDAGVARRLGFELVPNVLDAITARRANRSAADDVLARRAAFAEAPVGFDVVAGLAQPGDWTQLTDVGGLLHDLSTRWRHVVVDTGPSATPEQTSGGARNAATRAALATADQVVATCGASPLGVLRLLDWATTAAELIERWPVTVAVNRAGKDTYRRSELERQIRANLPDGLVGDVVFLPEDRRITTAAWAASPVARGRFHGAVGSLARSIVPERTDGDRNRRAGLLRGRR